MTRLHVDARLAGHSGIGTYLREMLPRVVPRIAAWRPRVLTGVAQRDDLGDLPAQLRPDGVVEDLRSLA